MQQKTILIVEDEPNILRIITSYFEKDGYEVYAAKDGETGLNIFLNSNIDLVILDIMLPKMDGFEVARRIRSNSSVPIIIMTALGEEQDMVKGYNLKIDDYIVKPFPPKVLVMKVNNLLSRLNKPLDMQKQYSVGELSLDFGNNMAFLAGKPLEMSKTEFKLLAFLVQNRNKACSRSLLLDEIWGLDVYVDNRIVDTYIKNLRKILKPYNYIKTVFGVGYQFIIEEQNSNEN